MDQMLIVSVIVLWVLVLVLLVLLIAVMRQVGVLHERIAPVGALMVGQGLEVGEPAPQFEVATLDGANIALGMPRSDTKSQLVFFLSPTCPICDSLIPVLRSLNRNEAKWLEVVLASDGDPVEHRRFIVEKSLSEFPYVLSSDVGMGFKVGRLPHAVLIDENGITRGHGLVNTREQVESLFEAMDRNVASMKDYRAQLNSNENAQANTDTTRHSKTNATTDSTTNASAEVVA